ncbi:MAG: 4-deoxy-4-formamido-L-arabinose-phosphoundecaprenol deformylase [Chlamydiae bacterium]|nr:4-deoxy-4-formamido-L-arabinose-phosphoundecaprenol deformylase [Chlamydiota bacterium]
MPMHAKLCVLSLKIDVDTYRGMAEGVPRLADLLAGRGVRASFFIAMGPDNSGRAVLRFFTRRGFLKKMLRSNAVGMYGLRTALSGTLLPARQIARSFPGHIRDLLDAKHEVGIHGHDHVRWHDRIPRMGPEETRAEFGAACAVFREIVGRDADCSAAPGWSCSPRQLEAQDETGMRYHSDSRGTGPFFPSMGGYPATHLQVPTTLPTLDELLGSGACASPDDLSRLYLDRISARGRHVLTVHAEAEGMGWAGWFDRLLGELARRGVCFSMLGEIADEALGRPETIPRCALEMGELPGRAGLVAIQS